MTNNMMLRTEGSLDAAGGVVRFYVALVVATLIALAVLSVAAPQDAGTDAWVHAAIVAVFAILLPLRLRAARHGSRAGLRAVGIVAGVLLLVNAVEASIPGLFPMWMRVEMIGIAALMAGVVVLVAVAAVRSH